MSSFTIWCVEGVSVGDGITPHGAVFTDKNMAEEFQKNVHGTVTEYTARPSHEATEGLIYAQELHIQNLQNELLAARKLVELITEGECCEIASPNIEHEVSVPTEKAIKYMKEYEQSKLTYEFEGSANQSRP